MSPHTDATGRQENSDDRCNPRTLRIWHLRGNKLAITVFDDYDDIDDKACNAWNFFEQDPNRIASITTRTWATVND
jgi:hypothetical protein